MRAVSGRVGKASSLHARHAYTDDDRTFLSYDQREVAVVDEDAFAGLDDVHQVLVVQPDHVLAARLLVLVVYSHRDRVAGLQLRLRVHALQRASRMDISGPILLNSLSYDLSEDYPKFIVRWTYNSDLRRTKISMRNIL